MTTDGRSVSAEHAVCWPSQLEDKSSWDLGFFPEDVLVMAAASRDLSEASLKSRPANRLFV